MVHSFDFGKSLLKAIAALSMIEWGHCHYMHATLKYVRVMRTLTAFQRQVVRKRSEMKQLSRRTTLIVILLLYFGTSAHAQLFGPRSIGRNSRSQQLSGVTPSGTPLEQRRFVRGQRAATDFVGSDSADSSGFVGGTQMIDESEVVSTVTGLREARSVSVNRPRVLNNSGIYPERLRIDFAPSTPKTDIATSDSLATIQQKWGIEVSISPREGSVSLIGTVPTKHDRRIVELLVMFEPGVKNVRNDLVAVSE